MRAPFVAGLAVFIFSASAVFAAEAPAAAQPGPPGTAILEDLKAFREYGTLLHVAAHPDDENTNLITAMAKGRHFRTAYLSVTRGDGGQNEIGDELDALLGLARTQELLSARKLDGGRQFFTRALDFGYSKTVDETMQFWGREEVIGDIVRVIRTFKPDVIVNGFLAAPQAGQHGNHNASAILALEAFKLSGDPTKYPEHLADGLTAWQPKRILQGAGPTDLTGTDPVTGLTFAQLSQRSRAMHQTQFGIPGTNPGRGGGGGGGARGAAPGGGGGAAPRGGGGGGGGGGRGGGATFNVLAGDPATTDLFEGIDTTWARVPNGGAEIGKLADDAIAQFKLDDPAASVPALLAIRAKLAPLPKETILDEKRALLDRIIAACLGLSVDAVVARAEVVPGESFQVTYSAAATRATTTPVRWTNVRTRNAVAQQPAFAGIVLGPSPSIRTAASTIPAGTRASQPYWLREQSKPGLFVVPDVDRNLIGTPENPPAFPVEFVFEIGGQTIAIPSEPYEIAKNAAGASRPKTLEVIPPVTVHFASIVKVLAPGATGPVEVELTANRADASGALTLDLPAGWTATPASETFRLGAVGSKSRFTFQVKAPAQVNSGNLGAHVTIGNQRFDTDRSVIDYNHIPLQLLQPRAQAKVVSVNLAIRGRNVGYLLGSGDDVAECLRQMGYNVTMITGADLTAEKLAGLDTVVIGIRAFDEKPELSANFVNLLLWVEGGGTVIAQYNRAGGTPRYGPYELNFAGGVPGRRTTDETSPVRFLAVEHPALTTPNRIAQTDFEGWVQERGTYYPGSWDETKWEPILAMNDPGEDPTMGSLLVARHGRGYYVYTGLAFFRQLPKGVPGAYRLFGNLVSLGK